MAKIKYRSWEPKPETVERLIQINRILQEYKGRVTVRQLYYRLVAADQIANNQHEYKRVQALVTDARYGGAIDWGAIEDRNREALAPAHWAGGKAMLQGALGNFRLDRWATQPTYLELWVEKAALAGVLEPIALDYHLTLMVTRGYSSASAMKEAADRLNQRARGRVAGILYIGDHDPSGLHMQEDLSKRLLEFGCPRTLFVRRVALTMAQIEQYNPPPNIVKESDSRAADYIDKQGGMSWEADALPPDVLDLTTRKIVTSYIDKEAMKATLTEENRIKARLTKFVDTCPD